MTAITFNGPKVHSIQFVEIIDTEESEQEFELDFTPFFFDDQPNFFILQFTLKIVSVQDPSPFFMELEYYGSFTTEMPITESFRESHFPHVNAPAIVYPFLRSFVSTITLNAGVNTPLLGTCNFLKLYQDRLEKTEKV